MKILIIEDNNNLIKYIKQYLNSYDYDVFCINDFDKVLEEVAIIEPDLIILDLLLPKYDGYYFLRLIRKSYTTPVIIFSSNDEEGSQIRGLELGADDYITKPFKIELFISKINALLRRVNYYSKNEKSEKGLYLNHNTMKLTYLDDEVELSKNEYKLLSIFLSNICTVVTREQLFEAIWDSETFVDDNTLNVNISRIKEKLSRLGFEGVIKTKRGVGYVFNVVDEENSN